MIASVDDGRATLRIGSETLMDGEVLGGTWEAMGEALDAVYLHDSLSTNTVCGGDRRALVCRDDDFMELDIAAFLEGARAVVVVGDSVSARPCGAGWRRAAQRSRA